MTHDELVEHAKNAIDAVFADKSVSPRQTLESLEEMSDEIEAVTQCLRDDIGEED